MGAFARGKRKVGVCPQQDRCRSQKSIQRTNQPERAKQYAARQTAKQRQHSPFFLEDSYPLEQFTIPENTSAVVWTGSRRLLLAILQEALRSFFQYRSSRSRSGKRIFREVQEWLLSSEAQWLYSFESICAHLGLDPDYLRTGLWQLLQETEKPLPIRSSKLQRRPFRLIGGPGSRLPRRSKSSAVREHGRRVKA